MAKRSRTDFVLSARAPRGYLRSYRLQVPAWVVDFPSLVVHVEEDLQKLLQDQLREFQFKVSLVVQIELRKDLDSKTARPYFRSLPVRILNEYDIPAFIQLASSQIEGLIQTWVSVFSCLQQ